MKLLIAIGIGIALCIGHGVTWAVEISEEDAYLSELTCQNLDWKRHFYLIQLCDIVETEKVVYIGECRKWKNPRVCTDYHVIEHTLEISK